MTATAENPVRKIAVVGGGSAGWIIAGLLAAEHARERGISVTLVESPDVPAIGVGEGTWPTMRTTLRKIGLGEAEFLSGCHAAFKQGTRFDGWTTGEPDDRYYHPFSPPAGYPGLNLAAHWLAQHERGCFADAVTAQGQVCNRNLAPKQPTTPEYAGVLNYAYHLDAGEFAELLKRHCTGKLGVRHVVDHVTEIEGSPDEDIRALRLARTGELAADLYVDCSGLASILLGRHYGVPFVDRDEILFNDRALAVQVPYPEPDTPIASQTIASAHPGGWIWDIGLTTRRGIGCVYSSRHFDDDAAERELRNYLERRAGSAGAGLEPRRIKFRPGHRKCFWHRNCVAVGMSAGFIEPLEASALVLVELAGKAISQELPAVRGVMDVVARRFNERFQYRWERIIDFLKLHYVLSRRSDSNYWVDHRSRSSIPESLADLLELWRYRVPGRDDFSRIDEVFSAASYQYILYGMGFETRPAASAKLKSERGAAKRLFMDNIREMKRVVSNLPAQRAVLEAISATGLPAARAS